MRFTLRWMKNSVISMAWATFRIKPTSPPAAVFYATERHLRFVMNCRAVDVAHAGLKALGDFHGLVDITAVNRAGETVLRVVGDPQSVFTIFCDDNGNKRTE